MAEKRVPLIFELKAVDNASGVIAAAGAKVRRSLAQYEVAPVSGRNFTRDAEEQAVRDAMARRIKAMREAAFQERVEATAQARLFGRTVVEERAKAVNTKTVNAGEESFFNLGSSRMLRTFIKGGLVGYAGNELANMTGQLLELQKALRGGQEDWVSMTVKVGESIPIIGGFVKAGQNIRELFTGERAQIEAINEAARFQNRLAEQRLRLLERTVEFQKKMADEARATGQRIELIGTESPQRELVALRQQYENRIKQYDDELAAAKKANAAEVKPDEEMQRRLDALRMENAGKVEEARVAREQLKAVQAWRAGGRVGPKPTYWSDERLTSIINDPFLAEEESLAAGIARNQKDRLDKANSAAAESQKPARQKALEEFEKETAEVYRQLNKQFEEALNQSEVAYRAATDREMERAQSVIDGIAEDLATLGMDETTRSIWKLQGMGLSDQEFKRGMAMLEEVGRRKQEAGLRSSLESFFGPVEETQSTPANRGPLSIYAKATEGRGYTGIYDTLATQTQQEDESLKYLQQIAEEAKKTREVNQKVADEIRAMNAARDTLQGSI